jgi:hypothetical protein
MAAPQKDPSQPKTNPFGSAAPVDTASKLKEKAAAPQKESSQPKKNPFGDAAPVDTASKLEEKPPKEELPAEEKADKKIEEPKLTEEKNEGGSAVEKEKKGREPKVVNSRAAMMGSAPDVKRDVRMKRSTVHCVNALPFSYIFLISYLVE